MSSVCMCMWCCVSACEFTLLLFRSLRSREEHDRGQGSETPEPLLFVALNHHTCLFPFSLMRFVAKLTSVARCTTIVSCCRDCCAAIAGSVGQTDSD